jgi:4-hydroxy-tetrahydrodipicolinate synthase
MPKSTAPMRSCPSCRTITSRPSLAHFTAIAQSTGLPIILYDVPCRTACSLADDTVVRLAEMPQFIGLKDATGDITRPPRLRSRVGKEFRLLTGDDATALPFLIQGGDGCISVTSNVAPGFCRSMYLALRQGQMPRAQRLSAETAPLTSALFRESNPSPLKYALCLLDQTLAKVRLPLVEPTAQTKAELDAVIAQICGANPEHVVAKVLAPERSYRATV